MQSTRLSFDVVYVNKDIARTQHKLAHMARRMILLADSSKLDIGASFKALPVSHVDMVITDVDTRPVVRARPDWLRVDIGAGGDLHPGEQRCVAHLGHRCAAAANHADPQR